MNSNRNSSSACSAIVDSWQDPISNSSNNELISKNLTDIGQLGAGCDAERDAETGDMYSSPMFWIGIYIFVASLICVLAMAADFVHAFRTRKFWVPCKYFTLNAASLTVIAVAMKLPLDLTTPMPGDGDEAAKLISLIFLASIMLHIMPSLASMDNKTLAANVIGLSILAITVCVNTWIQISTTLIANNSSDVNYARDGLAYISTGIILVVLMITISLSSTIPAFKEIINSKYQIKDKDLTDQHMQPIEQYVRRYWVMAQTGSPHFMMSMHNPLFLVYGVFCHTYIYFLYIRPRGRHDIYDEFQSQSPYKWSTQAILFTQLMGIKLAFCISFKRIIWASCFNYSGDRNSFRFLRVEDYWTKKLQEWKQHRILFLSSSRRSRRLIHISKDVLLTFCILFQIVLVFSSNMTLLMFIVFGKLIRLICFSWWFTPRPITNIDPDLKNYVLTVDDDIQMDIEAHAHMIVLPSVNSHISKAEKEQNKNLLELIKQSTGFEGVKTFDTNQVQSLPPLEGVNNWSLPIVTLTCIVVSLPNIRKVDVKELLNGVNEGLSFTHLVEENLNCGSEHVKLRKVSMALWLEVDNKCKWLGIPLAEDVFKGKKAIEIVKWFSDRAKEIVTDNMSTNQEPFENVNNRVIAANLMYRITETILHRFQSTEVTKRQLFSHLKSMIGDIFGACFTNIPRVIRMTCSESVIEKREESVKAAAKLLGKSTKIRELLDARQAPLMDVDKMAYIDEWRDLLDP